MNIYHATAWKYDNEKIYGMKGLNYNYYSSNAAKMLLSLFKVITIILQTQ